MNWVEFIPIITAIISLIGSYIIAKTTIKKEIKKIQLEQEHQLKLNAISAYATLKEKLNTYIIQNNGKYHREAISALGVFLACCPRSMLNICKELENKLINKSIISEKILKQLDEQWKLSQTTQKADKR